ncbi:hypothetical protein Cgig2_005763 [Carnegiea gigantea]|uniref:Uncharacterized protein n=1 Tax=Carnegiea gigantea TaxID=171969 RepID=A0A9Q1GU32_9CARY|nr:hypothetical protein Cgig2_005763 [Carnegiea gigantea]
MRNPFGYINGLTYLLKSPCLYLFLSVFCSLVPPCPKSYLFFIFVVPIQLLNCYDCPNDKSYNSFFFISVIATGWLFLWTKPLAVDAIYTSNQVKSKENLKIGETFLLSSHIKVKENLPSYKLLRSDIVSGHKIWARLPLHGEFSYKSLYWEKSDQENRTPHLGILSSIIDPGAHGWADC